MSTEIQAFALGELRIVRNGIEAPLPPSRKTRALLAYLLLTGRPHRRERLCEIFWDLPDDPRGSLRWALSRIRALVDDSTLPRVKADRERVAVNPAGMTIDYLDVLRRLRADEQLDLQELHDAASALTAPLLDGLDLPASPSFQAWLDAEREEAMVLRVATLRRIADHPDTEDTDAVRWLRHWRTADPASVEAAERLSAVLRRLGRDAEAFEMLEQQKARQHSPTASIDAPAPQMRQGSENPIMRDMLLEQKIGFCRSSDQVRLAHATVGRGPLLVKAANWLNHLELDWQGPIWAPTFQALARNHTLIRYDERGNGLSDWDVKEISFDAFVRDLEAVVDALGLERFALLGMSQGCAVSVAYAVKHPERVSALVLASGYSAGWRISSTPEERERREAVMTLTRLGWATDNSAYRRIFSQTMIPDGTPTQLDWFDEFQRQTTSPQNAERFQDAFGDIDVRDILHKVIAPTLVLHAREDQRIAHEQGRELAANIANAEFVTLESRSHIILGHEPAWPAYMAKIDQFLERHAGS